MAGKQVVIEENVEGHPWPRVKLYQKVEAAPEEVAAVFFDYRNAKAFVPKVIKSEISRKISPRVLEVDYGIDVPILPDEYYTARNEIDSDPDGSYTVTWSLVRATQTKASEGSLRIEKSDDGAVIRYTNFVTPSSAMARILKIPAIEQMRDTVRAIVRRAENQRRSHPGDLQHEVEDLREALGEGPAR